MASTKRKVTEAKVYRTTDFADVDVASIVSRRVRRAKKKAREKGRIVVRLPSEWK